MQTKNNTTLIELNARSTQRPTYGRGLLLDDVVDLLQRRPIVTLCGPAGVGKSHLAGAAAARFDRVRWTDAHRAGVDPDELTDVDLLVVDGATSQVHASLLAGLIYRMPSLGILVTSRQPIGVAGEQLVRVGPLPLPGRSSLAELDGGSGPAVDLLIARATAVDRRFQLGAEDTALVRELLHRTGGYPSAIEALAERLAVTPARLLLRDADTGTPLLSPIRAIASLDACLADVGPGGHRALELLAAARGPLSPDTLAAAGVHADDLTPLVERSLIELRRFAGGATTYTLPPTTIAALGAPTAHATADVRAALARRAASLAARFDTADEPEALNEVSVEIEAFEAAIEALIDESAIPEAMELAVAVAPAWAAACRPGPARRLLAELATLAPDDADIELWTAVLDVRYGRPSAERDLDALADRLNHAADIAETADTRFLALSALTELQTRRPDRLLQAIASAVATRDAADRSGDARRQAEAAFATALVRRTVGDAEGATTAVIEASQLAVRSGHERIALRCELLLCEHRSRPGRAGLVATLADLRRRADHVADRRCRVLVDLAELVDLATSSTGEAERRLISLIDEVHADADHVVGRLVTSSAAVLCAARGDAETATTLVKSLPCPDEASWLIPRSLAEAYGELCWKAERSLGRSARTAAEVAAAHLDEEQALALARRTLTQLAVAERSPADATHPQRIGALERATIHAPLDPLTEREADVLRLMAEGLSNKAIAAELGVAAKTVMHHAGAIYRKLRVSGRGEAAAAVLQGRIELEGSSRSA